MKRLVRFINNNRYKVIALSILFVAFLIFFITNSFATLTPTSSITVPSTTLSYSDKEEGAWQFTKTAKWISKGKAEINIKVNTLEKKRNDYTDVILVLDTSGSMVGEKLTQVQNDVNELINDTIPKGNKIALITFNDTATIVNNFTDDASLLHDSINNLTVTGETNYYQALVKVDEVLNSYKKKSNRDCVVLFLTDGLPTIETPIEVGEYKYLKSKYNYLDINGIQYELGDVVLTGIKNITDIQYLANKDNLSEFLYRASIGTANYDKFTLTDVIDTNYFNLNNVVDITTTSGEAKAVDNQIIWNLDGLKSGAVAELIVDVNLNNDLIGVGGIYPTNKQTVVSYKIGSTSTMESTLKTTILKDNYTVNYIANAPNDCIVSNMPSPNNYFVYDTVKINDKVPICAGYKFKEWKIVTENVEKVGNNQFTMPEKNVTLRATWKKLSIAKSMDGTISKVQTLYRLMADSSVGLDTNVNFNSKPTNANSGVYTIASTASDTYPVHYYRGNIKNNNVLFAGFCWKMVRTTSTGGVKLIYNGTYDETNKCNNTGAASQIGTSKFNSNYSSPADVGYMYGTRYTYSSKSLPSINVLNQSYTSSTDYYYGTSITYSNGRYTLQNATQKSWSDNYSTLTGYYTCRSTSTTCSTVYYIAGAISSYQYNLSLSGGVTDPATQTITLGKGMTDNGNNTYSLIDTVTVKRADWYKNYSTYKNYYMCKDLTSTTCDSKYLITSTNNYQMTYDDTFKYVYGNDVTWDGTKYTLIDTYTSINDWSTYKTTIAKKYHYTCLNTTGECTNVYYIHYFGSSYQIYYLKLSSGKNIEDAKDEMFTNTTDSTMKRTIDNWYSQNMTAYTSKLEDTFWCNDRTLYSGSLAGKDEDAGTDYSQFSAYNRVSIKSSPSIDCSNESRDGFTVSTFSGGNGKLTYPVGLLTADEVMLAGGNNNSNSKYYLYTGEDYWVMSPFSFYYNYANGFYVISYGNLENTVVGNPYIVRPSVSLAPGTKTTEGNGTVDDPYIVE